MTVYKGSVRLLIAVTAFALCGAPEALAQTQTAAPQQGTASGASQDTTQQAMPPAQTAPQNPAPGAQPGTTQQTNTWPTQDTTAPAPANNAGSANTAPAPSQTAPQTSPDANAQTQPAEKQRVVLAPGGQPAASQQNRGTTVDPSAAPIAPSQNAQPAVPTQTPEEQSQQQQPNAPQPQTQMQQKPTQQKPSPEPLGTAAAESVRTTGNGASKPAGAAVAPAKQHRVRSLLIKLGAVAAVGVAVGSVAAMTKGTPSTPPNTTTSTATR